MQIRWKRKLVRLQRGGWVFALGMCCVVAATQTYCHILRMQLSQARKTQTLQIHIGIVTNAPEEFPTPQRTEGGDLL